MKTLSLFLGALLWAFSAGLNAEHPEHPAAKPASNEHPEHPKTGAAPAEHPAPAKPVTLDAVAKSAAKWAKNEQKKAGGRIQVRDEKQGKDLKLKFVKIHKERLSKTAEDTYFVCADFKDQDGQVYDMDIFMTGKDPKKLKPASALKLHKQNGQARYGWVLRDGVWMADEAAAAPAGASATAK